MPVFLAKNQHFGQINRVICSSSLPSLFETPDMASYINKLSKVNKSSPFSDAVSIDPENQLTEQQKDAFKTICRKHDSVFNPDYSGYNVFHPIS